MISVNIYTYLMGKTSSYKSLGVQSSDFRFCVELPIKNANIPYEIQVLTFLLEKRNRSISKKLY